MADSSPDDSDDDSDQALIQRVKAGEESAFEVLFRRHMARVHRQAIAPLFSNGGSA